MKSILSTVSVHCKVHLGKLLLLVATVVRNKEMVCMDTNQRLQIFYMVWAKSEASIVLDCVGKIQRLQMY